MRVLSVALCIAFSLVASLGFAKPINKSFFGSLALEGYDAVAYHTAGKPVKGKKSLVHKWEGAKWRFSTEANLAAFKASPEKYAPQYGGYCAWAMAQGKKAGINPNNWKIVEGKLYLNYNGDIQAKWEADISGFITKADAEYPKLKD